MPNAWATLTLLCFISFFSFVDRGALALMIGSVKAEYGVSDFQIGVLFGTAYAVAYAGMGIVFGRLADQWDRRKLILLGVLGWSICTIGFGFASGYAMLILLRAGVAVGDATLAPAAYSMIGDFFGVKSRAGAASIFQASGFLGQGLGAVIIGFLLHEADIVMKSGTFGMTLVPWRAVFVIVGLPPLLLGLLYMMIAEEPVRAKIATEPGPSAKELVEFLKQNLGAFGGLFLGASLLLTINGAFLAWGPAFVQRTYGWDVRRAGTVIGALILAAATTSSLLGPVLTRFLRRRGRADAVALIALICGVLGSVLGIFAFLQSSPACFFALKLLSLFLVSMSGVNVVPALQDLVPARMRGTLAAVLLALFNLFAIGFGPPLAAFISDLLSPTGAKLGQGLAWQSALVVIPAIFALAWARARLLTVRIA